MERSRSMSISLATVCLLPPGKQWIYLYMCRVDSLFCSHSAMNETGRVFRFSVFLVRTKKKGPREIAVFLDHFDEREACLMREEDKKKKEHL